MTQGQTRFSIRSKNFAAALHTLAKEDADYWSYKKMGRRSGLHGLIRYPAMMVPQMQADVLEAALRAIPNLTTVIDPFVGSGTTMLETLQMGLSFEGYDINPLAILICRAKLMSLSPETTGSRIKAVLETLNSDTCTTIDLDFPGRDKWFTREASIDLSRIRRSIIKEKNRSLRRFLWTILAETIRQTSLSRETTYKLHIRSPFDLKIERPQVCFTRLALEGIERHAHHYSFRQRSFKARSIVKLTCTDIRTVKPESSKRAQLLITSPPYGDNASTIPYGQFSYLALRWICENDLEGDASLRDSAYATDSASLGGSSRGYVDRAATMTAISPAFERFFLELAKQRRPDLESKAASFTADLFDAIEASLARLEKGGLAIWTLGERRIGGIEVPLVQICSELNQFYGMAPVTEISRKIHSKRMPHKNSQGATMAQESMLVLCKS